MNQRLCAPVIRWIRLFALLALTMPAVEAHANNDECVILLHGLGRTAESMVKVERALLDQQYKVWNRSYPSTEANIASLATQAITPALRYCGDASTHFVTHSLGGILLRYYLQDKFFDGRIVMIAPPNQGSVIPVVMGEIKLYKKLTGPAGSQLGTSPDAVPKSLEPIGGEIGVIAGNRSSDPWFSWLIPGPDDGKVAVASTRLLEMTDWLEVAHGHTFIMRDRDVITQIKYFLGNGKFKR